MKGQLATGFVPYEIGDYVKLKDGATVWKVVELRLTQYVAAKKALIDLELHDETEDARVWTPVDKIEKRVTADGANL